MDDHLGYAKREKSPDCGATQSGDSFFVHMELLHLFCLMALWHMQKSYSICFYLKILSLFGIGQDLKNSV